MCSSGMMLWEVTVWVMLLSITALPVGGLDENMSVYRHVYNRDSTGHGLKLPTVNITIQNSIFSEALDCYNHAFGATIGGHNSMFCRNLFASNISRNCSIGMNEDFNLVNNVTF